MAKVKKTICIDCCSNRNVGVKRRVLLPQDRELWFYPEYIFYTCKALEDIKGAKYQVVLYNEDKTRPKGNVVVIYKDKIVTLNFMFLKRNFPYRDNISDIYKLIIREELKKILRNWGKKVESGS